jgi:hypothetical protein
MRDEGETKFEGIELRSRIIPEQENKSTAVEIYSKFKKLNGAEIPNLHRKM